MKKGCEAMLNGLDSPAVRCDLHFSSRNKQVDAAPRALIGKLRVGDLGVPVPLFLAEKPARYALSAIKYILWD